MVETPHLLTIEEGPILIVTLNRPEKLNAITDETMDLFYDAMVRFRETQSLKVMLIRATGRYFCAGADLLRGGNDWAPHTAGSSIRELHRQQLHAMPGIFREMEHIEKPIVVAHHGPCVGAGLEMSLSCDFRFAAKSATYSFPEGKFGVLPASNGVSRLVHFVGTQWARYLIMANLPINADKAAQIGLVHDVFPDETFEQEVMAFCRHLAAQHGEQMGTAKITIDIVAGLGPDHARQVERLANSSLMLAPDYMVGMERHRATIGKADKTE